MVYHDCGCYVLGKVAVDASLRANTLDTRSYRVVHLCHPQRPRFHAAPRLLIYGVHRGFLQVIGLPKRLHHLDPPAFHLEKKWVYYSDNIIPYDGA